MEFIPVFIFHTVCSENNLGNFTNVVDNFDLTSSYVQSHGRSSGSEYPDRDPDPIPLCPRWHEVQSAPSLDLTILS